MTAIWILMLATNLLLPLTMIGFGWSFSKRAPQKINPLFGYRTAMSMKNKETWAFAHRYFGRLWLIVGLILLPVTVLAMVPLYGHGDDAVAIAGCVILCVQCVPMLIPILPTERALKNTFDENGNPVGM